MRLTNIPMLSRPARTGDLSKAILNSTDQRPQNPAACPGGSSVITGPHPDVGPRSRPFAGLIMGTGSQCRGVPPYRHFNAASGRPIGVSRRLPRPDLPAEDIQAKWLLSASGPTELRVWVL